MCPTNSMTCQPLPHLSISLLIGVHKHCGCAYTYFLLVAERLREQEQTPRQRPVGGSSIPLGTYLRTVSFGVTLHILHSCQRVKTPNNPVAEGRRGSSCTLSSVPSRQSRDMPRGGLAVEGLREARPVTRQDRMSHSREGGGKPHPARVAESSPCFHTLFPSVC